MSGLLRIGSREIYRGRVFDVSIDSYADEVDPSRTFEIEVVHHNGGAGALAIDDAGRVVLVRQWRYPLGRWSLEMPAGRIEPGHSPLETARRELEEEAGVRAAAIEPLAEIQSAPGFTTERLHLFLARELVEVGQCLDEDEHVEVVRLGMAEAITRVTSGEIDDAKTVVALLMARERLTR
jgi:ADP-ribose pyrophosphatase